MCRLTGTPEPRPNRRGLFFVRRHTCQTHEEQSGRYLLLFRFAPTSYRVLPALWLFNPLLCGVGGTHRLTCPITLPNQRDFVFSTLAYMATHEEKPGCCLLKFCVVRTSYRRASPTLRLFNIVQGSHYTIANPIGRIDATLNPAMERRPRPIDRRTNKPMLHRIGVQVVHVLPIVDHPE